MAEQSPPKTLLYRPIPPTVPGPKIRRLRQIATQLCGEGVLKVSLRREAN